MLRFERQALQQQQRMLLGPLSNRPAWNRRGVRGARTWMKHWALCVGCAGAFAACGGSKGSGSTDAGLDEHVIDDRGGMDGQPSSDLSMETTPGQDAAGNGCWPACIATLQAQCPHPVGGACVAQMGVGYNNYCFSTGVIERVTPTDGGLTS